VEETLDRRRGGKIRRTGVVNDVVHRPAAKVDDEAGTSLEANTFLHREAASIGEIDGFLGEVDEEALGHVGGGRRFAPRRSRDHQMAPAARKLISAASS
jgi:hypothetical protein